MKFVMGFVVATILFSAGSYAAGKYQVDPNTGRVRIVAPSETVFTLTGGRDDKGDYHMLAMDADGRVLCNAN